eukprot:450351_1
MNTIPFLPVFFAIIIGFFDQATASLSDGFSVLTTNDKYRLFTPKLSGLASLHISQIRIAYLSANGTQFQLIANPCNKGIRKLPTVTISLRDETTIMPYPLEFQIVLDNCYNPEKLNVTHKWGFGSFQNIGNSINVKTPGSPFQYLVVPNRITINYDIPINNSARITTVHHTITVQGDPNREITNCASHDLKECYHFKTSLRFDKI